MPLDTVLCLDTSGSMSGAGIRELKNAVNAFLDGVIQTALQTNLRENVAVVEFGANTRIVHPLSTDYISVKRAVAGLTANGTTPMFEGLMLALHEIVERGGVVRLGGTNIRLTPRVILMTDGRPDNKDKVAATAIAFSPKGFGEVGLPHPIPIACVGCGDEVDKELLAVVAVITNGMFVVGEIDELSTFFRRQVLLIRFLVQFQNDMSALRNMLILRAFLEQCGESADDEEAEALMKLLLAMLILQAADDDDENAGSISTIEDDSILHAKRIQQSNLRALPAPQSGSRTNVVIVPATPASNYSTQSNNDCCCTII